MSAESSRNGFGRTRWQDSFSFGNAVLYPCHAEVSPGLGGYPEADDIIRSKSAAAWGGTDVPDGLVCHKHGKGSIWWGKEILDNIDNLYPDYGITSRILLEMGIGCDFSAEGTFLRHLHKTYNGVDYYFVSNPTGSDVSADCHFRVKGRQPQLWDPMTGEIRILPESDVADMTSIPLRFEPYQSYFIVFDGRPHRGLEGENFPGVQKIMELYGPWEISFDPDWGGPEKTVFETLADWSVNENEGIRYYSGTAVYSISFDLAEIPQGRTYLNLGDVRCMARVTVNGDDRGVAWTLPWKVEITGALRKGRNELEVEVTNQWTNRLVGDERGSWGDRGRPYTYATYRHYNDSSPLLPSGLLGPVTICSEKP